MKAFQVTETGRPARLQTLPDPEPGPDQALVRIAACGLNFADLLMVQGKYQDTPPVPFTLGMEFSGVVRAVGRDVSSALVGQRVAIFGNQGGLADFAAVSADRCLPIPDSMSFQDAAGFQVAYGTSHLALFRRARLQPGETLLVLGASGGVGLTAVEIGKAMGARVIAVARGQEKLSVARTAGADHLIDSETDDIRARVLALGGADVVYDPVGGDQFKAALRACRPEARVIVIGFASGEVPQIPANILLVKNITVIGFYWGGYGAFEPSALTESMAELFAMYQAGKLKPHISSTFPLDKADQALDMLASRKATGKIVVTMG